jgi:GT2 family glycosyltransferase
LQGAGILPDESSVKEFAGEILRRIGLDGRQISPVYASSVGDFLESPALFQALAAKQFTGGRHTRAVVRPSTRIILHLNPSKGPDNRYPLVSVVVVNWNRRDMLRGCLRSLSRQEAVSFEVILVDNGSTDGSVESASELAESLGLSLSVIRNSSNRGFCAANNQGIAAARGEWIALLNNDAEAESDWLAAMVRAADGRREVGMVACKILAFDEPKRIDKAGHLIWLDGQNRGRGTGEWDTGQYDCEEDGLWPDGCAALYRKEMLDSIGGFDEDLFAYGDDAELGLRARIAGWLCVYTPGAVVRHRRGSTLGLLSSRRIELIERNRLLLAVRHFPVSLLWLNPVYFGIRLVAGAVASFRGRGEAGKISAAEKARLGLALLHGLIQGIALVPRTLRKRRQFAHLRSLSASEVRRLLMRNCISLRELSEGAN